MKFAWLNNRYNWLGKILYLPQKQQVALFILLALALFISPLLNYFQDSERLNALSQDIASQQQQIEHQQKILQALKRRSNNEQLTPELAATILPINQRIQQLESENLVVKKSQWNFNPRLILELDLTGHFQELSEFINDLLTNYANLQLIHLDINQMSESESHDIEHSIESHLILQLNKE